MRTDQDSVQDDGTAGAAEIETPGDFAVQNDADDSKKTEFTGQDDSSRDPNITKTDSEKTRDEPAEKRTADDAARLKEELRRQTARAQEFEDLHLRALADFENLQKRMQSETAAGVRAGIDRLVLGILTVLDELLLARDALERSGVEIRGITSILKKADSVLEEHEVRRIPAKGAFDPRLHEAISVTEDDELEDGTITKEIRRGYTSCDKVIRPSLVEISKQPKDVE